MRLRAVDPTPTAAERAARGRSIRPPEQGCGGKEGEAALTGGTERPGAADGCTQHRPKRRRAPHRQLGMQPQRGQKPRFGEKRSSEPPARPPGGVSPSVEAKGSPIGSRLSGARGLLSPGEAMLYDQHKSKFLETTSAETQALKPVSLLLTLEGYAEEK